MKTKDIKSLWWQMSYYSGYIDRNTTKFRAKKKLKNRKMKIYIHKDKENNFQYFEATGKDCNLLAYKITDLINQLFEIYGIDMRCYLFNGSVCLN